MSVKETEGSERQGRKERGMEREREREAGREGKDREVIWGRVKERRRREWTERGG